MAEPSRRNSGFETTSKSIGRRRWCCDDDLADELAGADRDGGLVDDDLVAVHEPGRSRAATASTCERSVSPSALGGVPTAMKMTSDLPHGAGQVGA